MIFVIQTYLFPDYIPDLYPHSFTTCQAAKIEMLRYFIAPLPNEVPKSQGKGRRIIY
jgi:hypothetical protein